MKKTYEKPVLQKREALGLIAAGPTGGDEQEEQNPPNE